MARNDSASPFSEIARIPLAERSISVGGGVLGARAERGAYNTIRRDGGKDLAESIRLAGERPARNFEGLAKQYARYQTEVDGLAEFTNFDEIRGDLGDATEWQETASVPIGRVGDFDVRAVANVNVDANGGFGGGASRRVDGDWRIVYERRG